ncbi:enoyl-CoA hydratase/isomerase family protein [Verminephrobacter aporrectodeae]|uniref:enoyl-CoA hydratase/isomerase family protein n=1 Tax=Verminephrobacter aporrectodeae TaxID=1110389 RepID=UPI002237062E|nr:enoyl-CoA hydratase/isomerase family protein [Verminephrobacter aporrectodeae]MCW5255237.1 enoyl-CoA hydratase/isomerase family protein [Verminephrobacter aporrectodeae subsp. tuberculatae]MCW8174840.1 enoyl-CoA hydratase/isomerase family protein [Verminephrobacter aporrectodeae subsp. tuberculatae]MCW8202418.1 enoyl-CoA hydratase/isomerase family protein [Verminephrobacter aporrectodeae subsp. tuberculatae]MCW8206136.1 enoyl-CoA hydratase/isomerase family protein [Verminephrobacter aporrect
MTEAAVLLDCSEGIAQITLNCPRTRNALSQQMREELAAAIARVRDADTVHAVLLSGAGSAFCSGGDITQMLDATQGGMAWRERIRQLHRWLPELMNMEKPVIAAVDGPAFGAGFSLALAADFILATPRARFCAVFGRIGLVPDLGAMQLLPRIVGLQRAKELVFTARTMAAEEARALGIVYDIVPEAQLQTRARALAARFADASTAALGMAKSIMNQAFQLDAHAMAEMEAYAQTVAHSTDYHQQAVARFQAREPLRFDWDRRD